MSPRRRRRSRRRTSRRSGPLSLLLVVVLVAGIGYLLVQRGVLPAPPGPIREFPKIDGSADNSAAIAKLGGAVDYGKVDPVTGQRSGIRATINPAMVAAAARDKLGSAADPEIRPPGLDELRSATGLGGTCSAASSGARVTSRPTSWRCTRRGPTPR
jgi:hypothetical protein